MKRLSYVMRIKEHNGHTYTHPMGDHTIKVDFALLPYNLRKGEYRK